MPTPRRARTASADSLLAKLAGQSQADFEIEFYERLIHRLPDFAEVLQAQSGNLAAAGRLAEGLKLTERVVRLRPADAAAHFTLACRLAQLKQRDQALAALRQAIELGFRNLQALEREKALAPIRMDPRFRHLVRRMRPS